MGKPNPLIDYLRMSWSLIFIASITTSTVLFFQTRSRAVLYKYFEKNLADMIWKHAAGSKGEVGAIDGDPLYDAQDMQIRKFVIGKPSYENGKARVNISFENFGQKKTIVFLLANGRTGWRISD